MAASIEIIDGLKAKLSHGAISITPDSTEAPKGLTAKHMDYGSREYGFWILDLSTRKTKKFLKIKLIDRLII
jgi:hypothetical protein